MILNAHSVRFAALLKALDVAYSVSGNNFMVINFMVINFMTVTSVGFVINYDASEKYSLCIYIGALQHRVHNFPKKYTQPPNDRQEHHKYPP